jgi:hypothetical protein
LDGFIRANGTNDNVPARGSGGGIRIDVETLAGPGQIQALGGVNAGGGRIAIYYQNAAAFDLNRVESYSLGSFSQGGAGTVYLQGPGREGGELIISSSTQPTSTFFAAAADSTPIASSPSALLDLTNLRVKRGARVRLSDQISLSGTLEVSGGELTPAKRVLAQDVTVNNRGVISQLSATPSATFKLDLAADTIQVDSTSRIDVTGRGFLGGAKPGNPFADGSGMTVGFQSGSTGVAGGSYGGLGGGGTPTALAPETLYTIGKQDASLAEFLTLGRGDGGETIAFNPDDGLLYHSSGFNDQIFESVNLSQLTTTDIPLTPSPDFTEGTALTYWQSEGVFLIASFSKLFRLSTSGGLTLIGEMDHESKGLTFAEVEPGLEFLFSISPRDSLLRLVDPGSATTIAAGPITLPGKTVSGGNGLATDPTTGELWAVVQIAGQSGRELVMIDPATGVASVGNTGAQIAGLAFDSAGTLYGVTGDGQSSSGGGSFGDPNPVYGNAANPNDPGSGGAVTGEFGQGGSGGGLIRLSALNIQLDGAIVANGEGRLTFESSGGGGSGGGIRIDVGSLIGAGQITANGGRGDRVSNSPGAGGGGGRIAIYYQNATGFDLVNRVTAAGGLGAITSGGVAAPNGKAGTVFTQQQPIAMLTPGGGDAPVMRAEADVDSLRMASVSSHPFAEPRILHRGELETLAYTNRVSELLPVASCLPKIIAPQSC